MKHFSLPIPAIALAILVGCESPWRPAVSDVFPSVSSLDWKYADIRPINGGNEARRAPWEPASQDELPIEGMWVEGGWMGDAATTKGVLSMRVFEDDPDTEPTCVEWTYDPQNGTQDWIAVGYQYPDGNWGSMPGKDLSLSGFTTLTFAARGKEGGERLIFKSGGHTSPEAKYAASYQCELGVVTLTKEWKTYSITLPQRDGTHGNEALRNVTCAFVFATNRQLCPGGAVFYIDSVTFRK